ncbi:hypothetical protein Egran_02823, partial [Elaphomyces granulatus]
DGPQPLAVVRDPAEVGQRRLRRHRPLRREEDSPRPIAGEAGRAG